MRKIQELFDSSKKLDRAIESVVTFGANTEKDLISEISEYVVTEKLHNNYENVYQDIQTAFNETSKEVGIWVSGFYGSGKSSFAKYLGLSFDKSLIVDGVTFGERLMSRIQDTAISAMYRSIINLHNPQVVLIDLSTQSVAGKVSNVSDIIYFETLKLLGITKSTDLKVINFIEMLHNEGKYEEFCRIVEEEKHKTWDSVESNNLIANSVIASIAPRILPAYFSDSNSYKNLLINSSLNEKERFLRLYNLIKEKTKKDKIIFVLDEVGQYVASNIDLILNLQGLMQIIKDEFKGKVWIIATAQQTLTEDNVNAQLNSNELFRLNDRFPIKVDIEANDIKEIITKRLLGKSTKGQSCLKDLFSKNQGIILNSTHLTLQERSIYNSEIATESFINLYPFLPVHIDILLSLLQKLASRTGGVGLRSVIRLIRDILVDNHLADAEIGKLATADYFYDALHSDMDKKNETKEIVAAADKAINLFSHDTVAVRICKIIAIMQLLTDFNLTFDNICALLYDNVGEKIDKVKIREIIDSITQNDSLTLQEVDGKYQFMTNAILGIREEYKNIFPRDSEKSEVLQELLKDIFGSAPAVNIYSTKTINVGFELCEKNKFYNIFSGSSSLKLNIRFVEGSDTVYQDTRNELLKESTKSENSKCIYWLCVLNKNKEVYLNDIVRSQTLKKHHLNESNKEIQSFLRAQGDFAEEKKRQLETILNDSQANSEIIFRGSPQQVNGETYKTIALKNIAEKVFEKYPFANANMKGDSVTKLANYDNLSTIPPALNPLKIIQKDGTIDNSNTAFAEVKDYIAMRNEASGQEIMSHFESAPYGWSKDTLRYIVALMLKASLIQLRVSGKEYKVFGESAVNAMQNNNSFGKITISLNTEGALTPQELMKAASNLTKLFNSPRIAPVKDQIAKEANRCIKNYYPTFNKLVPDFEQYKWAGLKEINQAINYAKHILDSEGGDAAYLLGKDENCFEAFNRVMNIIKRNDQTMLIANLKKISYLIQESDKLPKIEALNLYNSNIDRINNKYNILISNPDFHTMVSEITDLLNTFESQLKEACYDFQNNCNNQLDIDLKDIKSTNEFNILNEEDKQDILKEFESLKIYFNDTAIDKLQNMVNRYTTYYLPGGRINSIKEKIKKLAKKSLEKESSSQDKDAPKKNPLVEAGGAGHEVSNEKAVARQKVKSPKQIKLKRKLLNKSELESLIKELSKLLEEINEDSPVELDFED